MTKRIILANPRGFCAGVDRAIQSVQTILNTAAPREDDLPPVYVRRQIVHNRHVVDELAEQGAVFVDELSEIPQAAAQAGAYRSCSPRTACRRRWCAKPTNSA